MVRKKVKKKKVGKTRKSNRNDKSRKKIVSKNVRNVSRKDFEVFAIGVERLEELRKELNGLDTKKFPVETASIRSKLKNVSYIPQIEKEIKVLRSKIKGRYKAKKRRPRNIVHKKIKELEKEVKKRRKISSKDKKLIGEIPKIENQLSSLRRFVMQQEEEEKQKKELLKKIDPGVNLVVDERFDLSLNEIKAELSKKLKEKDLEVKNQLQGDLEARKRNFELQYKDLEDRFARRYGESVKKNLKKEVKKRFRDELNKKINNLKGKIRSEELVRLNKQKEELKKDYGNLRNELILKNSKNLKADKKRLEKLEQRENEKIKQKQAELRDGREKIRKKLLLLKDSMESRVASELKQKEDLLKREQERVKKLWLLKVSKRLKEDKEKLRKKELELKQKEGQALLELSKVFNKKERLIKKKDFSVKISREHIKALKEQLKKELESKKNDLEKGYGDKLIKDKMRLKKDINEEILARRVSLNNQMHEHLTKETKKLHEKYRIKEKDGEKRVEEIKKKLNQERGVLGRIKDSFSRDARKLRANEERYKKELETRLEHEKQRAIKRAVKKQSLVLRKQLRKEFENQLNLELQKKQAEFNEKKANLNLEIQNKMKKMFV